MVRFLTERKLILFQFIYGFLSLDEFGQDLRAYWLYAMNQAERAPCIIAFLTFTIWFLSDFHVPIAAVNTVNINRTGSPVIYQTKPVISTSDKICI